MALKLNGTHQVLFYADGVNILVGSVHTIKKKQALVVGSKEMGLEVNADETMLSCLEIRMQDGVTI